jgi:hypothetical protein
LWTEEEEKTLAIPFTFDLSFTKFTAIINGVGFYKSGDIRSITLFPGEAITIQTAYGDIQARNGFSLYESGELESLEPLNPALLKTPIGAIAAFDPNAIGVNADSNSLVFDVSGRVASLITVSNRIAVTEGEHFKTFSPREVVNPLDDETMITEGLKISFDYNENTVTFEENAEKSTFSLNEGFTVIPFNGSAFTCSPSDCASCSMGCK